jgi:dihydroorotate dehydrogenase electron transfer subunit
MYHEHATVLWNEPVGKRYFKLGLTCHADYAAAIPGQFVMLRLVNRMTPLLRRPFSIHRLIPGGGGVRGLEILYQLVGDGTRLLAEVRAGEEIDLLGPLGRGFAVPPGSRRVYLAAGGIGVAPMLFLAQRLNRQRTGLAGVELFLGGRNQEDLLCREAFSRLELKMQLSTDDGSCGDRCFITQPLRAAVEETAPDILLACGPMEMLKCVAGIAREFDLPCQVSIEAMMACGMGACLGCAVERRAPAGQYLHVCRDGPVIDAQQLNW